MQYIAKITQKGQVTIPKEIRDMLGLTRNSKVRFDVNKRQVRINKAETILDFAPIAEAPKGMTALKAREEMEKNYTKYDKRLLERL